MKVDCQQHRRSMELLGLRNRLEKEEMEAEERDEIDKRIRILEEELGMD